MRKFLILVEDQEKKRVNTDDQRNHLKTVKNEAQNERVRKRAHAMERCEQHRNS